MRCPQHRREDLRPALVQSFADGWRHFTVETNEPIESVDAALTAIERGSRVSRTR